MKQSREERRGERKGGLNYRERKLCTLASDLYSPKKHLWELPVCVCLNAWMVGWLRVKEAIMYVSPLLASSSLSHRLAQQSLCAERGMMHTVILSSSIIHAFPLALSPFKLACLHGRANSFEHHTPNVGSQASIDAHFRNKYPPQREEMLISVQCIGTKMQSVGFVGLHPKGKKLCTQNNKSKDALR